MSNNPQANPYAAGEPIYQAHMVGPAGAPAYENQGDGTGGLIPYKNPKALLAYYLGIFSFIPLFGIVLGFAALVLGILGLKDRRANPIIKGSVHAWIGIVVGGSFALLYTVMTVMMVIALIVN
jgi:hypothetical protein